MGVQSILRDLALLVAEEWFQPILHRQRLHGDVQPIKLPQRGQAGLCHGPPQQPLRRSDSAMLVDHSPETVRMIPELGSGPMDVEHRPVGFAFEARGHP